MNSGGYTAEITKLSPRATERDMHNFFAYSGVIELVEIIRSDEDANTAWEGPIDDYDNWSSLASRPEDSTSSSDIHIQKLASTRGEAVTMAQEVAKTMVAKGYVLGKDALIKAKDFDESHGISSTAKKLG